MLFPLLVGCLPAADPDPSPPPTTSSPDSHTGDTAGTADTGSTSECTVREPEGVDPYGLIFVEVNASNIDSFCEGTERICVHGRLDIRDVDDLQPLSCLESVEGDLYIQGTTVQSLAGLEALQTVGDELVINFNERLESLDGLGPLTVGGQLSLTENHRLTSLRGLEETTLSQLFVERNDRLASLEGLSVTHLDGLHAKLNPGLTDLTGLESLETLDWGSVDWLEGLTSLQGLEGLREVGHLDLRLWQSQVDSLEPLRGLIEDGVVGTLKLSCSPQLTTLSGLDGLRTVESLSITGCEGLTSLDALAQLETVTDGDLSLTGLPLVTSLDGLGALTSVDGQLHLVALQGLTDFQGLDSLETVTSTLNITANPNLRSLDGLEALRTTGDVGLEPKYTYGWHGLILNDNPVLDNLDGLHELEALHSGALISGNASLSQETIDELLSAIDQMNGAIVVENNGG